MNVSLQKHGELLGRSPEQEAKGNLLPAPPELSVRGRGRISASAVSIFLTPSYHPRISQSIFFHFIGALATVIFGIAGRK
jgi:hypothetical protein